jgi:hypothetical protein
MQSLDVAEAAMHVPPPPQMPLGFTRSQEAVQVLKPGTGEPP